MAHSAEEVLLEMYDYFSKGLEEINEAYKDVPMPAYARGVKNSYIEGLEIVQKWKEADKIGLDWVIEDE